MTTTTPQATQLPAANSDQTGEGKIAALAQLVDTLPKDQKDSALGQAMLKAVGKAAETSGSVPKKPGPKAGVPRKPKADKAATATSQAEPVILSMDHIPTNVSHEGLVVEMNKMIGNLNDVRESVGRTDAKVDKTTALAEDLATRLEETHEMASDARSEARAAKSHAMQAATKAKRSIGITLLEIGAMAAASSLAVYFTNRRNNVREVNL